MVEGDADPFGGFGFAIRTFQVSGSDLRVSRRWQRTPLIGDEGAPKSEVTITGTAVGEKDDVCVIGTRRAAAQFHLILTPDSSAKERWEFQKVHEYVIGTDLNDNPPDRLLRLQVERFDKVPPTAVLFVYDSDSEIGIEEGWTLECQMDQSVFNQLCGDLVAGSVDRIFLGIEWEAGLVQYKYAPPSHPNTWGLIRRSEDASPEPMRGYLTSTTWRIGKPTAGTQRSKDHKLAQTCEEWTTSFYAESKEKNEHWGGRSQSIMGYLAKKITENHNGSAARLSWKLDSAKEFVQRLDSALHENDGPFANEKYNIWEHRDLGNLIRTTKPSQRESFVDLSELSVLINEYLSIDWLQNEYLGWVFLDVIVSTKIISSIELYLKHINGVSYEIFSGTKWKMIIWKIITRPLTFLFGWILPAVGFYYIGQWSLPTGIGLAVIYYGYSSFLVAKWLFHRLLLLLSGKPTPTRRLLELTEETEAVYSNLAGPMLHLKEVHAAFDRARDRGVGWDHRVFYILDRIGTGGSEAWKNRLPNSGAIVRAQDFEDESAA